MIRATIGQRLKDWRMTNNASVGDVAGLLDISEQAIQRIEEDDLSGRRAYEYVLKIRVLVEQEA